MSESMWAIRNRTSFEAASSWGRDNEGTHVWIVAVKGTFDIGPRGRLFISAEQPPPLLLPVYNGEPGESSLMYDADLGGVKPETDVVLKATAYAPGGRASTKFSASAQVGRIEKTIRVHGNRYWGDGLLSGRLSAAEPITEVPVVYERAHGGYDRSNPSPKHQRMDPRNPVGCSVFSGARPPAGQALPNFEYPNGSPETTGPAGFGPLDAHWSPRREWIGNYTTIAGVRLVALCLPKIGMPVRS